MEIDDWREEIDQIDGEILSLLNQRASISVEIGKIKRERDIPVYSPEREEMIMTRLVKLNQGPLRPDGVRRVFERIIDESRKLEKDLHT